MKKKEPFCKQAAVFSLIAPFIIIVINLSFGPVAKKNAFSENIIGGLSIAFVVISFVFGVIALLGMRKHGRRGILLKATAGLILNGLLIVGLGYIYSRAREGNLPNLKDLQTEKSLYGVWENRVAKDGKEQVTWLQLMPDKTYKNRMVGWSVANYSGTWSVQRDSIYLHVEKFVEGNPKIKGKRIVWPILELGEKEMVLGSKAKKSKYTKITMEPNTTVDDMAKEYWAFQGGVMTEKTWVGHLYVDGALVAPIFLNKGAELVGYAIKNFSRPFSIMMLEIDNRKGRGDISIDPKSAKLFSGDKLLAVAYSPLDILNTAKEDKDIWVKNYSGMIVVPAAIQKPPKLLFFPPDINISALNSVELTINGKIVRINGRLYTSEELKAGLKKAKELRNTH